MLFPIKHNGREMKGMRGLGHAHVGRGLEEEVVIKNIALNNELNNQFPGVASVAFVSINAAAFASTLNQQSHYIGGVGAALGAPGVPLLKYKPARGFLAFSLQGIMRDSVAKPKIRQVVTTRAAMLD